MGNLFDNAIEASQQLPEGERMIRIYMDMKGSQLYILYQPGPRRQAGKRWAGGSPPPRGRAMDTRMYRQEKLIQHYAQQDKTFFPDGPLARCARGPMGLFAAAAAAVSGVFTGLAYAFVCLRGLGRGLCRGQRGPVCQRHHSLSSNVSALWPPGGDFRSNAVFLRTTYEFLDIPNTMYQGSLTTEKRSDRHYEIEFRDVSFRYPNTETWGPAPREHEVPGGQPPGGGE